MARNEIEIGATPERVWAVLADAERYSDWVLGAQEIEEADASWPAVGARMRHRTGVGPLTVEDDTVVEESDPGTRLVLRAHLGAAGAFRISLELLASPSGTKLVMHEHPVEGIAASVPGVELGVRARNSISLERLKELAEGATPSEAV